MWVIFDLTIIWVIDYLPKFALYAPKPPSTCYTGMSAMRPRNGALVRSMLSSYFP